MLTFNSHPIFEEVRKDEEMGNGMGNVENSELLWWFILNFIHHHVARFNHTR